MDKLIPLDEEQQQRSYLYEWRRRNPDKVAEYQSRWYEKNAEKERERKRTQYQRNPEAFKAASSAYYHRNKSVILAKLKTQNRANRVRVFESYGGAQCRCCGESVTAFLTIDHINGCTKEQRKQEGLGSALITYLIKHNFPPGFQVLCFNCNLGREANGGVCPHQEQQDEAAS